MRVMSRVQSFALLLISLGCHVDVERTATVVPDEAVPAAAAPDGTGVEPQRCDVPSLTLGSSSQASGLYEAACVEETLGDDGCPDTRTTRSFDGHGRVSKELVEVIDESVNLYTYMAAVDHVRTLTYDDAGRLVLDERDELLDGTVDERVARTFDDEGRLARVVSTRWGTTETVVFDEGGREIERRYEWGDGAFWLTTSTFTGDGRPLSEVTESHEPGQEPAVIERVSWTYDDGGRLLSRVAEHDAPYGGLSSEETQWIYRHGVAVRTEERTVYGPCAYCTSGERLVVTELDARGNPVLVVDDFPLDGVPDQLTERTFDEAGRKLTERMTSGDGAMVFADVAWVFDGAGRLLSTTWHPTNSWYGGSTSYRELFSYDDDGELVRVEHQSDGVTSYVIVYQHDDEGRLLFEGSDYGGDGSFEWSRIFERDSHGNLLSEAVQSAESEPLTTRRLGYGCL